MQILQIEKKFLKIFFFWDNCIWIGSRKFSRSSTEYLSAAIHVLTNTFNISPNTKGDIFQINFPENDEKTWSKGSHGDFQVFVMLSNNECQSVF